MMECHTFFGADTLGLERRQRPAIMKAEVEHSVAIVLIKVTYSECIMTRDDVHARGRHLNRRHRDGSGCNWCLLHKIAVDGTLAATLFIIGPISAAVRVEANMSSVFSD